MVHLGHFMMNGGIFYSFLDAQGLPIDFYIIPTSSENDDTGSAQNGCADRIPRLLGDMVRNKSENKYRAINDSLNVVFDRLLLLIMTADWNILITQY